MELDCPASALPSKEFIQIPAFISWEYRHVGPIGNGSFGRKGEGGKKSETMAKLREQIFASKTAANLPWRRYANKYAHSSQVPAYLLGRVFKSELIEPSPLAN